MVYSDNPALVPILFSLRGPIGLLWEYSDFSSSQSPFFDFPSPPLLPRDNLMIANNVLTLELQFIYLHIHVFLSSIQWTYYYWWQFSQCTTMLGHNRMLQRSPGRSWRIGSWACTRRTFTSNIMLMDRMTRSRSETHKPQTNYSITFNIKLSAFSVALMAFVFFECTGTFA